MILKELFASNFKLLNFESSLKFPEGITLIAGKNESGKSTILDAILYALFGKVIKPQVKPKKGDIIRFTQKKANVKLDFVVEGKEFRVERTIFIDNQPTKAILYEKKGKGFVPISTSVKEVNKKIEEIMGGISYQEIVASNIVAQKDLGHLINKSSTDRKNIINIFLNLDSYNKTSDDFKKEINEIKGTRAKKGQLQAEEELLSSLNTQLEDYKKKNSELKTINKELKEAKKKLKTKKEEFEVLDTLYKALEEYEKLKNEKEFLEAKIKEQEKLKVQLQEQLSELERKEEQLKSLKEKLKSFENLEKTKLELENAEKYIDTNRSLSANEDIRKKSVEELEQTIKKIEETIPEEKDLNKVQKITRMLPYSTLVAIILLIVGIIFSLTIHELIGYLLLGLSSLPLILSVYSYFIKKQLKVLLEKKEQIDHFQETINRHNKELERIRKDKKDNEREFITFLKRIVRYKSLLNEKKTPYEIFEEMKCQYDNDKNEGTQIITKYKVLEKDISVKQHVFTNFEKIRSDLKTCKEKLSKIILPSLPGGVKFSRRKLEETKEKVNDCNLKITELETKIEEKEKRKEELIKQIKVNEDIEIRCKKQKKIVNDLKHRLAVLELAKEGIDTTTQLIRERVRPNVQAYMSSFLPLITSNKYRAVQIDDNYNLSVWDPSAGMFKELNIFSGGTEDQFLLSMRLAFALALMPKTKSSYPNFLFLDEPFASSDIFRRENIVSLISTNLSRKFKQIFIISHIPESEFEMVIDNVLQMEDGRLVK